MSDKKYYYLAYLAVVCEIKLKLNIVKLNVRPVGTQHIKDFTN